MPKRSRRHLRCPFADLCKRTLHAGTALGKYSKTYSNLTVDAPLAMYDIVFSAPHFVKTPFIIAAGQIGRLIGLLLLSCGLIHTPAGGAGVTIITHGLNDDTDGWITGMADQIPNYPEFPGANFSTYKMYFYSSNANYYLTAARVGGGAPADGDSGEIIVKLDWGPLADGDSYNTFEVAQAVAPALLNTNFIAELGGHALVEFPLHLIGHSRGGSLMSQISLLLGTNGIWVDQLSTLDPHPLNNDGFDLDFILYSAVDAPVHTYQNVLFHDNDYETINPLVHGESVAGAYVRQLTVLDGGYTDAESQAPYHSDVHLWYQGTVDLNTPASYLEDGSTITVTPAIRTNWWEAYENEGANAGFYYSLIGRGDRSSADEPLGPGQPAIRDGYNQWWDLGAGVSTNRTVLPSNNGDWPNLIRFDRLDTNQVVQGQSAPLKFYYQWAQPDTNLATVRFYIDDDLNPLNGNGSLLKQMNVPGNGAGSVSSAMVNVTLDATNAARDTMLCTAISGGGQTRYLRAGNDRGHRRRASSGVGHHPIWRGRLLYRREWRLRTDDCAANFGRFAQLDARGDQSDHVGPLGLYQLHGRPGSRAAIFPGGSYSLIALTGAHRSAFSGPSRREGKSPATTSCPYRWSRAGRLPSTIGIANQE